MKALFDQVSYQCSKQVTESYSTSFSLATKMLDQSIRQDIYNIYGFVRFADEIVDSFHDFNKAQLFERFENDLSNALEDKISLNPILNAFQHTFHKYQLPLELVTAFMKSMKMDLTKEAYITEQEYRDYIYGSADVVGLMCLKVFVKGDTQQYQALKSFAMSLGSAFQKVNFLRDLKADFEGLNRTYFPNTNLNALDEKAKERIIEEIEEDFQIGLDGISRLPKEVKFGVYTAYIYYYKLLEKLKNTPPIEIKNSRIRVANYQKMGLLLKSYLSCKFNLLRAPY